MVTDLVNALEIVMCVFNPNLMIYIYTNKPQLGYFNKPKICFCGLLNSCLMYKDGIHNKEDFAEAIIIKFIDS